MRLDQQEKTEEAGPVVWLLIAALVIIPAILEVL